MYFRWWLSDRLVDAAPMHMLNGSVLLNLYLPACCGVRWAAMLRSGTVRVRVPSLINIGDGANERRRVMLKMRVRTR